MSYGGLSKTIFQCAGGFALMQTFVPVPLETHAPQPQKEDETIKAARTLLRRAGLVAGAVPERRDMEEDIAHVRKNYPMRVAAVTACILACGGVPALVGAGTNYFGRLDSGAERYMDAKDWLRKQIK